MRAGLLPIALLTTATAAHAQVTFSDDFEGATFVQPSGQWSVVDPGDATDSIARDPLAALTGQYGVRMTNRPGSATLGLERYFGGTGDEWARVWFRFTGTTDGFDDVLIIDRNTNFYTACELYWNSTTRTWRVTSFDRNNAGPILDLDAGAVEGAWHLVEMFTNNMGTTMGRCRVWVDGNLLGDVSNINWSGLTYHGINLGPLGSGPNADSVNDFDDFGADGKVLPGALALSVAASSFVGACEPVDVTLVRSIDGAPISPATSVSVTVATDAGQIHASAGCAAPGNTGIIAGPSTSVRVYLVPSVPGAAELIATSPGLLPARATVQVSGADGGASADGGRSEGPRSLTVGCGCGSVPAVLPLLALALARRRRRAVTDRGRLGQTQ